MAATSAVELAGLEPETSSDRGFVTLGSSGLVAGTIFRSALTSHLGEDAASQRRIGRRPRLRRFATIGVSALVCIGPAGSVANPAARASGRLAGKTQISFGCPGPTTEPPCNPWRPFPHAHFSLAQRATSGDPFPGTGRTVTSDARGRFALRLPAGSYLITPVRERHTHGGKRVIVRVRAGKSTNILVRFDGFPQMDHP
jgi:hypothetical protein